ncbi:MAG: glucuronate isomerase [Candidatus Methylacidiphilales bacterium]|nr:glucuronate isomerase [Candidatus Methylacidiphilales bacterium]
MKPFLDDDFLLHSATARRLYHEHAARQPIYDYHCHLSPAEIAGNRRFRNLTDAWLAGDHYKWRAMRSNGVPERFCTGDAPDYEKFLAFARTVPRALRNPLYHWTHLELRRYFGIETLLNEETAPRIWDEANEKLSSPEFSVRGILDRFRVAVVCTTDDPADTLEHHAALRDPAAGLSTRVYPTFRPDKALAVDRPEVFRPWVDKLENVAGRSCADPALLIRVLQERHAFFHGMGGRLSDHGLERCPVGACSDEEAMAILGRALSGRAAGAAETAAFTGWMMIQFGRWDAARGWTKQMHLGALRNNNQRLFRALGPDIGCDSIGDSPQATALSWYLNALDETGELPRTVLYNLNPADNYVFATMIGNFQDGTIPGKIQFGSGWWFLDQKEGMEWQLNALSSLGLLGRFVGMLTDSRSFLSFARHEYFRRILCDLVGREVERGELPDDRELLAGLVEGVCFGNAADFFNLELDPKFRA